MIREFSPCILAIVVISGHNEWADDRTETRDGGRPKDDRSSPTPTQEPNDIEKKIIRRRKNQIKKTRKKWPAFTFATAELFVLKIDDISEGSKVVVPRTVMTP